jgi:hypothetical protein
MIIVSLVGIFIILALVNAFVWNSSSYGVAALISLVALVLSVLVCAGSALLPPVSVTALLVLILSLVCSARNSSVRRFRLLTVVMGVVGLIAGFGFSVPYINSLHRLRDEYPLRSLESRLAYEGRWSANEPGRGTSDSRTYLSPPPKGAPAWDDLAAQEKEVGLHSSQREWALRTVHASTVEQFASAPGFGITRMSYVSDYWLQNRRRPAAPLSAPSDESSPPSAVGPLHVVSGRQPADNSHFAFGLTDELSKVHREGVRDFLNPESFGLVVDRDRVAGFEPHGFSGDFRSGLQNGSKDSASLELTRLELVSLLKSDTPRVYISNHDLPRLGKAIDPPTRALSPFENAALGRLEKGDDFVFSEQGRNILACGSLRARAQCLDCHEVQRGALLGAFSYQFRRDAGATNSNKETPRNVLMPRPELHGKPGTGPPT